MTWGRGHNSTWNSDPSSYLLPMELPLKKVSKLNSVLKIKQLQTCKEDHYSTINLLNIDPRSVFNGGGVIHILSYNSICALPVTLTSELIRLFTNFMTLISKWLLTIYERFPWILDNGCGIRARYAYPSGPRFRPFLVLALLRPFCPEQS